MKRKPEPTANQKNILSLANERGYIFLEDVILYNTRRELTDPRKQAHDVLNRMIKNKIITRVQQSVYKIIKYK